MFNIEEVTIKARRVKDETGRELCVTIPYETHTEIYEQHGGHYVFMGDTGGGYDYGQYSFMGNAAGGYDYEDYSQDV